MFRRHNTSDPKERRTELMRRDIDEVLTYFLEHSDDDFAFLGYWFGEVLAKYELPDDGFDTEFISNLVYCGWFVFSYGELLPKFHRTRCVIDLDGWNIDAWLNTLKDRQTILPGGQNFRHVHPGHIQFAPLRKRLRRLWEGQECYELSMNSAFGSALHCTNEFHRERNGTSWLAPGLTTVLEQLCPGSTDLGTDTVQTLSWELWDDTNTLVATDIGIAVGAVYSSLTGFSDRRLPSLGIVQLAAQAIELKRLGFKLWDLGMAMTYKLDLGARCLPCTTFRDQFRQHRGTAIRGTVARRSLSLSPVA
jgi:Leu/Phe-tRNA-protein transferase